MLKVQLGLLWVIFVSSCWVLYLIDVNTTTRILMPVPYLAEEHVSDDAGGFLISTKGCRIPFLNVMDEEILEYIYDEKPILCGKGGPLVLANDTHLMVDYMQITNYDRNLTDIPDLYCCYRPFWRRSSNDGPDVGRKFASICIGFVNGTAKPNHEFVRVECSIFGDKEVYRDYFYFIRKHSPDTPESQKPPEDRDKLSVYIIGLDGVSRLNLHRQMPRTTEYLLNNLTAIEYLGYNKIADNTFPNLVGLLAGKNEDEIISSCWKSPNDKFDLCPFIWKEFKSSGYKTAFVEDSAWMGIFNYVKRGFGQQPTDFYSQVFFSSAEEDLGHETRLNSPLCIGKRKTHKVNLDMSKSFIMNTLDTLGFGLFWVNSISHDYLNLPHQADQDYLNFFMDLRQKGVLDKSLVIFMSDHGIRWGGIRSTYQGYLEERLPIMFFMFPDWFKNKYGAALRNLYNNRQRLTTPFDLHPTLRDLMDLKTLERENLNKRIEKFNKLTRPPRGISLFIPISPDRTCAMANITDEWCSCHESEEVPVDNVVVKQAGIELIHFINKKVERFPQCSKLTLKNILRARKEAPTSYKSNSKKGQDKDIEMKYRDYRIVIEAAPSNGRFEGMVREFKKPPKNANAVNRTAPNFSVVGTVSRINPYGHQGDCLPFYKLRLYCYCI